VSGDIGPHHEARHTARLLYHNLAPQDTTTMIVHGIKLTPFQIGYLTAALFSSNDESDDSGGDPLDDNYTLDNIDPSSFAVMCAECDAFEGGQRHDVIRGEDRVSRL